MSKIQFTEHAGEGTYIYDCADPDCYFCERMKVKPIIKASSEPRRFSFRKYRWGVVQVRLPKRIEFLKVG